MIYTFGTTPWPEIAAAMRGNQQRTRDVLPGLSPYYQLPMSERDMEMHLAGCVLIYDHAGFGRQSLGLWAREHRRAILEPYGIDESL